MFRGCLLKVQARRPIYIDTRAGSKDLIEPLTQAGLPVEATTLEFGDLAFMGRGEGGAEVFIGIEHKKFGDFVQSLTNERLTGHQLPGLVTAFDRAWLIIEGEWKHDAQGRVVVRNGRGTTRAVRGCPPAIELEKRLACLETRGGVRVRHTNSRRDSLRVLIALYRFWTDRDLDEHKSHLAIHAPDMDATLLTEVSDFRRVVAQMPGIGYKTSKAVEAHFDCSFRRLMLAGVDEWAEITTLTRDGNARRLGKARAQAIVDFLRR